MSFARTSNCSSQEFKCRYCWQPEMFSDVEMQRKISLYSCTVPLLTLMGPKFTRGGKLKYLTCLYDIFGGCTTIKYSESGTFTLKADRPSWNWLRMCAVYHVPTFSRIAFYHNNCHKQGSYCLNYKGSSKTLALY